MTLQEILEAPDVDWKAVKLDPQKGDDYLLASILDFRAANPGQSSVWSQEIFQSAERRWDEISLS